MMSLFGTARQPVSGMGLRTQFNLVMVTAVTLLLSVYAGITIYNTQSVLKARADQEIQAIGYRLQRVLPAPLWNFDAAQVAQLIEPEMHSHLIRHLRIVDNDNKVLFEKNSESASLEKAIQQAPEGQLRAMTWALIYSNGNKESPVGQVQLWLDYGFIHDQLLQDVALMCAMIIFLDVVLSLVIGALFAHLVVQPSRQLLEHVVDLAQGRGDLTQRVPARRGDEFGRLAQGVNAFIACIQDMVSQVQQAARSVANCSRGTLSSSHSIDQQINLQRNNTNQLKDAFASALQSSQAVKNCVEATTSSVNSALATAHNGLELIHLSERHHSDLAKHMLETQTLIDAVNINVSDINNIINTIKNIAAQTNLLALNAAIEAARAGDEGRGFAVVADEVRALAIRTQAATEDIHQLISGLQESSGRANEAIAHGQQVSDAAAQMAEQSAQAFTQITDVISQAQTITDRIASFSQQQTEAMECFSNNIIKINEDYDEASSLTHVNTQYSEQLAMTSEQLNNLVARFKL